MFLNWVLYLEAEFSYCLVPFHSDPIVESRMSFGNGSEVLGEGVVSTSLVYKVDKTPYFVTPEGISVGDKFVAFSSSGKVFQQRIEHTLNSVQKVAMSK